MGVFRLQPEIYIVDEMGVDEMKVNPFSNVAEG